MEVRYVDEMLAMVQKCAPQLSEHKKYFRRVQGGLVEVSPQEWADKHLWDAPKLWRLEKSKQTEQTLLTPQVPGPSAVSATPSSTRWHSVFSPGMSWFCSAILPVVRRGFTQCAT